MGSAFRGSGFRVRGWGLKVSGLGRVLLMAHVREVPAHPPKHRSQLGSWGLQIVYIFGQYKRFGCYPKGPCIRMSPYEYTWTLKYICRDYFEAEAYTI